MAWGPTWSEEDTELQIEIWSDEDLAQLLVTTHKNSKFFPIESDLFG